MSIVPITFSGVIWVLIFKNGKFVEGLQRSPENKSLHAKTGRPGPTACNEVPRLINLPSLASLS